MSEKPEVETPTAKKTVAKKAPAKKAPAKQAETATPSVAKPAVTARRPISKDEYARTLSQRADETSLIPPVKAEEPKPNTAKNADVTPTAPKAQAPKAEGPKVGAPKIGAAAGGTPKVAEAPKPTATPDAEKTAAQLEDTAQHQALDDAPKVTNTVVATATTSAETQRTTAVNSTVEDSTTPSTQGQSKRKTLRRKLTYIEPWTVTKMAFVISVAMMIVTVVAVVVFWFVLQVTGIWQGLNDSVLSILSDGSDSFDINNYVGLARITGFTLIVAAFNVVFFTALATISAHLYNLAASLMGGLEVTFEERSR